MSSCARLTRIHPKRIVEQNLNSVALPLQELRPWVHVKLFQDFGEIQLTVQKNKRFSLPSPIFGLP